MKESYLRPVTRRLIQRIEEPVRRITVVAGPRQIGKTTSVHQTLRERPPESFTFHAVDAPEVDTDLITDFSVSSARPQHISQSNVRDAAWLIEKWQAARLASAAWLSKQSSIASESDGDRAKPYVLVFDEIQNISNWSSVVKGLWDQDRARGTEMHVLVLGSAPLLVQSGLSESLMGRFELLEMTHWSYSEMSECFGFTLDQYLYFGGYPGPTHWVITGQEDRWRSEVLYSLIEPNLVKDVLALARIEKPAVLRQLFQLGCSYSGQIVALTKLLVQLTDAGNTTTLTHYLQLLRAAGLLAGLEKYAAQAIRQRAAPPKLNVLNTAFLTVYSGKNFAQARSDPHFWGHLVESSIGAHLLNTATQGLQIAYWRESPFEVDFVIHHGNRVVALEVKSGTHDLSARKGLRAFSDKHPSQEVRTEVLGGDDFAVAEALTHPAKHWLQEP
jgi:predicted AAA+ superfamily ATPase